MVPDLHPLVAAFLFPWRRVVGPGADQQVFCSPPPTPNTSENYLLPRSPVPLEMHRGKCGRMTTTQLVKRIVLHLQLGA